MEFRINCKHFNVDCKCNSTEMPKRWGIFRRECIVVNRLEKCALREDLYPQRRDLHLFQK